MVNRVVSLFIVAVAVSALFVTGCTQRKPVDQASAALPAETYVDHTVRFRGETVGLISKWYTGSAKNWNAVQAANPGLNVTNIQLGQVIRIPERLVVKKTPLTQEFVLAQTPKPVEAPVTQAAPVASARMEAVVPEEVVPPAGEQSADRRLMMAVMIGDENQTRAVLAEGANPNASENNRPLLAWAAQNGTIGVVKALLEKGAAIDAVDGIGHTALMRAVDVGQLSVVEALIAAKANVNVQTNQKKSALTLAIDNNQPGIVSALLAAGADATIIDDDGDSLPLIAAQNGSVEIVQLLGKSKADFNLANAAYSPLSYAIEQNNRELVKAILAAGADVNGRTPNGGTPLMQALSTPELAAILIDAKADVNAANTYGETLLMLAVDSGSSLLVSKLLAAGASTTAVDQAGKTALARAEERGAQEIVTLLQAKS